MQLLCDAGAFRQPFFKANGHLSSEPQYPQSNDHQYDKRDTQHSGQPEPPRPPEDRLDLELQQSFRAVPLSLAIRGHHVEKIRARIKVGVARFALSHRITPVSIETVELVPEPDAFRSRQAQTREAERQPLMRPGNSYFLLQANSTAICGYSLNVNQSRSRTICRGSRIDKRNPAVHRKPNSSELIRNHRTVPLDASGTPETIGKSIFTDIVTAELPSEQFPAINAQHSICSRNPQTSLPILFDSEDRFTQQIRHLFGRPNPPRTNRGEPSCSAEPKRGHGI